MEPALDWARRSGDITASRKTDRQKRMRRAGVRIETLLRFLDVPRRLFFSLRNPGWSVPQTPNAKQLAYCDKLCVVIHVVDPWE
jgi:hypothetical protein